MRAVYDPILGKLRAEFDSAGNGSVSSVSVVSANGFAGTVANSTTTPAITIKTNLFIRYSFLELFKVSIGSEIVTSIESIWANTKDQAIALGKKYRQRKNGLNTNDIKYEIVGTTNRAQTTIKRDFCMSG